MAIAALTINSQRKEVVDFTVPFYDEVASVVIKVKQFYFKCSLSLVKKINLSRTDIHKINMH